MPEENRTTPQRKKNVIEKLKLTKGIITPAIKAAEVHRSTFYKWMKTDKKFKAQVEQVEEIQKDYVESKLIKLIEEANPTAVIFYMKTKCRDRGYSEKFGVEVEDKRNNDLSKYDDEVLNKRIEAMRILKEENDQADGTHN